MMNLISSQSVHESFIEVDLEVADYWAAPPRDERSVLGGGALRPPSASYCEQCHHRIQLPHGWGE